MAAHGIGGSGGGGGGGNETTPHGDGEHDLEKGGGGEAGGNTQHGSGGGGSAGGGGHHNDVRHALRNGGHPGSVAFVNSHLFLSFALLLDAIGLKFMFKHLDKYGAEDVHGFDGFFLSCSQALVQCLLLFIRQTHQGI